MIPPDSDLSLQTYGAREYLTPAGLAPDGARRFAYSYGVRTGNVVWVAGQVARDRDGNLVGKGDVEAQCVQVFENLKAMVEASGGTLDDVVQTTTYITDRPARAVVNAVRARYFREPHLPAATLLIISGLGDPEYLVEIEAVAVLGPRGGG